MTIRKAPPGRASISQTGLVKPLGPHHFARCAGSVHILNTSSRGASMMRLRMSSRSAAAVAGCAIWMVPRMVGSAASLVRSRFLSGLDFLQVFVQPVEALFPEPAVMFDPIGGVLQWRRLEPARPPLRRAAARDQAGTLEHLQMLRDRRQADLERFGQFGNRRLARGEPRQDRPPRRIGERRQGRAERIGHPYYTDQLINRSDKYGTPRPVSRGRSYAPQSVSTDRRQRR